MGQMSPASNWVGLQVRASDAVMIVPTGLVRGVHEITLFVSYICAELAKRGPTFDLRRQGIEEDAGYI